ncbi:MAG TPA: glutamate--tRNA ligase [Actinomycetota bacterium]|nr:glutamate--tRNA ligase [Actinomycetota bacterium]
MRVRFAPAPTGYLHVGGARTALYNWLFARHHSGVFILRIEDTDRERSTEGSVEGIQDVLHWLGLEWDEGPGVGGPHGPYRQTERLDLYRRITEELAERASAYPCYCTPEELAERRKQALALGEPPGYDGRCRNLSDDERRAFEAEGRPKAWRFAAPGRDITVPDLVHGEATFPASDIKDFVILRSDGTPTYLLAAAVDDWKMEVTHVLRGEDLHSSTPRQLLIMEALSVERVPQYAHLPLLLGPDRAPLSKRHGSVAVEWFREQGFLPDALVNYLALLGWSYDDHTELFTRDQLVEYFDLARVARNPAVFDPEKLEWMNGHYIRESADHELAVRIHEVLERAGVGSDLDTVRLAVPSVKERMKTLAEAVGLLRFLFQDVEPDDKARALIEKAGPKHFRLAAERFSGLSDWTAEDIHEALDGLAEELGLSRTKAWQPVRAVLTGSTVSPPLPESISLLGRQRTLARLAAAAAA